MPKLIFQILFNKIATESRMTVSILSSIVGVTFRLSAIVLFIFTIFSSVALIFVYKDISWAGIGVILVNVLKGILVLAVLIILSLYAILLWGAANEIDREQDKNYIVAIFSGVVSFVALIIGMVALCKEEILFCKLLKKLFPTPDFKFIIR